MRWSRIKNIIILLLLIVNLSLLGLVGLRSWRSRESVRQTWEQTVALLERRGLRYLPEEDPGELTLLPLQVTLSTPGEDRAAALLGAVDGVEYGERTVTYTSGGSTVVCSPGALSALLSPGLWPLDGRDPGELGLSLLDRMGWEGQEAGRWEEGGAAGTAGAVTYTLSREGAPVHGWISTLNYSGGSITSLSLRPLDGTAQTLAAGGEPISAATALARFLETLTQEGYVCSQVTALYPGYTVTGVSGDQVTLSPVWYIETDAQPSCFAVDGYTGGVTAMG